MKRTVKRAKVKPPSKRGIPRRQVAPRTLEQFTAKPERFQKAWKQATHVISKMRSEGQSLRHAARDFGIDPRTVRRLAASALRKGANGRYAAKASDQLLRVLLVPTHDGAREIAVRGSRQASELAEYWVAAQRYLRTGDAKALKTFAGKRITAADGSEVPLLTKPSELDRLGSAGVLSFESIYAKVT